MIFKHPNVHREFVEYPPIGSQVLESAQPNENTFRRLRRVHPSTETVVQNEHKNPADRAAAAFRDSPDG